MPSLAAALILALAPVPPRAIAAAPPTPVPAVRDSLSPVRADSALADSLSARVRRVPPLAVDSAAAALPGALTPLPGVLDLAGLGPRLVEPSGIAIDAFGRFVVSDAASHRVMRYDRAGAWLGEMGSLGSDPGQLRRPTAVVTLGSLGVAVLDRENRRVVSYDLLGRRLGVLVDFAAEALVAETGRIDAVAMASDRGGALYLADADRDRILVFDFQGRYQRSIGGYGTKPGAFRGIAGLTTTPRGELIACERAGRRVQQLDAGGRVVRAWSIDVAPGRAPLAVACDDSARVAVADTERGWLGVFDRQGKLWAETRALRQPRALAFAPDGTLLVAESAAMVRRFALSPRAGTAPHGD